MMMPSKVLAHKHTLPSMRVVEVRRLSADHRQHRWL